MTVRRLPVFSATDACNECRGACCETLPGVSIPEDWGAPHEVTMRARISAALSTGRWALGTYDGAMFVRPAVRGREHTGPIDDGEDPEGTRYPCTFHGPRGCELPENARPSECLSLEPRDDFTCEQHGGTVEDRAREWAPYQGLLRQVVDAYHVRG